MEGENEVTEFVTLCWYSERMRYFCELDVF